MTPHLVSEDTASARFSASEKEELRVTRLLFILGVAVVVLQRFSLEFAGFSIPITPLLVLSVLLVSLRRQLGIRWQTHLLLSVFTVAGLVLTILVWPDSTRLTSLFWILLLWVPSVFAFAGRIGSLGIPEKPFAGGLVLSTAVAGFFGIVQSVLSALTGYFWDPVALLPVRFLVPGYNTTYPIQFGGTWMKSNGLFFLEPSFLSLFSVLALILIFNGLVKISKGMQALVGITLTLGFLSSVAISGLVLLPALLLSMIGLVIRHFSSVLVITTTLLVTLGTLLTSWPVMVAFTNRLATTGSNEARLVRPYTELLPIWAESSSLMFGLGPGAARDYSTAIEQAVWIGEVTTPTVAKILFEYGLFGMVIWMAIFFVLIFQSRTPRDLRIALLLMMLVPTDGLTNHVLVPVFVILLSGTKRVEEGFQK